VYNYLKNQKNARMKDVDIVALALQR